MPRLAQLLVVAVVLAGCAQAFGPVGPQAATDAGALGCQKGPLPGAQVRDGDPLAPGEPLAGLDATSMTPAEVGTTAVARGLRVTWRYSYGIGPAPPPGQGADVGFSECWCVPPPDGRVNGLAYGMAGEVVVFVDSGTRRTAERPQPASGWGC